MPGEKTLAIVLKTQDYRDTSLLVSFLTPGHGKVRALVKGGRDARVKLGSTLEPFSLNEVLLYRRRRGDLHLATSAELVELFAQLRTDCRRLAAATLCCEWVEQLVESGGAHPEIFEALRESLRRMNEPPHDTDSAVIFFAVRLLISLGLMPILDHCVHCRAWNEPFRLFSAKSGGVVCERCRGREESMIVVSDDAVRRVERMRLGGAQGEPLDGPEALALLERFIDFHLQYPPHSRRFLDKILQFERKHKLESACTFKI